MPAHCESESPALGGLLEPAVYGRAVSLVSGAEQDLAHLPENLAGIRLPSGDRACGVAGECRDRSGLRTVTADVADLQTPGRDQTAGKCHRSQVTTHVEHAVTGVAG